MVHEKDGLHGGVRLPAEWEDQEAVMLTWPHEGTDWAGMLEEVELSYAVVAREILRTASLLVVCRSREATERHFSPRERARIRFYEIPSNDTWARDHGPVCTFREGRRVVNDFTFNGCGNKFNAGLDNMINASLYRQQAFPEDAEYRGYPEFVLEGGSIESDGRGTILTTAECLLNPNRNHHLDREGIEGKLRNILGATRVLWLNHGYLEGDDTDSHIDTLARFCDEKTICYVRCDDPGDIHFRDLKKMEEELQQFRRADGEPYRLVALPMADPVFSKDGRRMSATYANFLFVNGALLVPLYGIPSDEKALAVFREIFSGYDIRGVNCISFIEQNGSLHCITMQIPKGFLR
jgi:agmatine/peptidylarginine deiminase